MAWLPTLLGLGPGDVVVVPSVAYPTYEDGARLAGATTVRTDSLTALGPDPRVRLVWVNSPGNPTGRVLPAAHLRKVVEWARERGAVVASDECYLPLGWDAEPVSVLSPEVCGGSYDGVLAVHSLSKRSNLAGYRAGFVAGDPALVAELLKIRKHAGLIVPAPVQAAMVAALGDQEHADAQRSATASGGRSCARRSPPPASPSSTRRPGSTSGSPGTRTAGRQWTGWPAGASWWPPVSLRPGRRPARPGGPHRVRRARGRGGRAARRGLTWRAGWRGRRWWAPG
ncbi:aminotransferase class I/II-fold pyridoxal phosphate-dependent enzyme [Micromonospora sp. BRA006-A]|nr:aminotransferase class I/II-fold pyridoxal phosphate-dependent enzyme [Micromonospora sp. BRA006-A]